MVIAETGIPWALCLLMALGQSASDSVTIHYPDELPLDGLVDYAGQTLGVNILYGQELSGKTVTLRPSPVTLPRDRLLDFVRSVLRMHGLALVADDLSGFHRVVPTSELPRVVTEIRTDPAGESSITGRVVTQAIAVRSGDTQRVATHLKAFVSSPQSLIIEVPERSLILVTDHEPVVQRLIRMVELIDEAPPDVITEVVTVQTADAARVSEQAKRIMLARSRPTTTPPGWHVLADVLPHALVLVGTAEEVKRIRELIGQLDVATRDAATTRPYLPRHVSATRLRTLVEQLVLSGDGSESRLFVDEPTNTLYLTAGPSIHLQVAGLLEDADDPVPSALRRLRVYRPKHRKAAEVLDTLLHLLEDAAAISTSIGDSAPLDAGRTDARNPVPSSTSRGSSSDRGGSFRVQGPDYVLTEDAHTNAIIALGTPEFHEQVATLIEELDRRRAQVLIEMTLVAVTLSDSLSLGFELQALDLGDGFDYLLFTDFGLSEIDLTTGQRILAPGVGGNGVLISPDGVPLVLKALATHGNSRVISTPRIVVSDYTSGTIRSVDEAPFTSINASDTVATTSFAGFESAGTTLTVTPRIAQGDHITLDYTLNFSNFTGVANDATSPPPRTTNSFSSVVEVPDGYTVVVGGLVVDNDADSVSEIPLLGRIPVLGALFQNSTTSRTRTKVFAFIRPVILRDDQFEDLKYITQAQLEQAELKNTDFPPDIEMWMR